MNQNLDEIVSREDEIISPEEEKLAKKFFRRFWPSFEREQAIRRIRENVSYSENEGRDIYQRKGIKDFRTGKYVILPGFTQEDKENFAAYRVEGRKMGYYVGKPVYNKEEEIITATVRKINPASDELTKEEKRERADLIMKAWGNFEKYLGSNLSLNEIRDLSNYLRNLSGQKRGK